MAIDELVPQVSDCEELDKVVVQPKELPQMTLLDIKSIANGLYVMNQVYERDEETAMCSNCIRANNELFVKMQHLLVELENKNELDVRPAER